MLRDCKQPTFKFSHDVLQGLDRPVISGPVLFNVTRTAQYQFKADGHAWEDGEVMTEAEVWLAVQQGNPDDPTWEDVYTPELRWEYEVRNRVAHLRMTDKLDHLRDNEGERLDDIETTVTVLPGGSFEYGHSWSHEEGWSARGYQVEWRAEANGWYIEESSSGRDCDGAHGTTDEYFMSATDGAVTRERGEVYDQFAQLANY